MIILHCLLFFTFRSHHPENKTKKPNPNRIIFYGIVVHAQNRIFFDWFLLPSSVSYIEFRSFYFAPSGNEHRAYGNFMLWRTMQSVVLWRVDARRVSCFQFIFRFFSSIFSPFFLCGIRKGTPWALCKYQSLYTPHTFFSVASKMCSNESAGAL